MALRANDQRAPGESNNNANGNANGNKNSNNNSNNNNNNNNSNNNNSNGASQQRSQLSNVGRVATSAGADDAQRSVSIAEIARIFDLEFTES